MQQESRLGGGLRKVQSLLSWSSSNLATFGRLEFEDLQLVVWSEARKVLRRDEDELAMFHLLRGEDQCLHRQLSSLGVQENIKLVKNAEGCLELFTECEQQANRRERAFSTTDIQIEQLELRCNHKSSLAHSVFLPETLDVLSHLVRVSRYSLVDGEIQGLLLVVKAESTTVLVHCERKGVSVARRHAMSSTLVNVGANLLFKNSSNFTFVMLTRCFRIAFQRFLRLLMSLPSSLTRCSKSSACACLESGYSKQMC